MSRAVNIDQVKNSIHNYLDQHWSNNHMLFYQMLLDELKIFKQKAHYFKEFREDTKEIALNMKEQPWFKYSRNKNTIINLIQFAVVEKITNQHGLYNVLLKLNNNCWFEIEYYQKKKQIKYRVSFRDQVNHAYICYYNNLKDNQHQLPDYIKVESMLPLLDRYDIIMLTNEIVMYYDIDNQLSKLPIGNKYPITLSLLAEKTVEKLTVL